MSNKYVIYTSLTGAYDNLPQYEVINPQFDYICFSNDFPPNTQIGQWKIRPIPLKHNNPIHMSRYAKLLPHRVLPSYEWSIWLDANLKITDDRIYSIIKECIIKQEPWNGIKHPKYDCIYDDALECLKLGKAKYKEIMPQIRYLNKANYPKHFGLFENNFIIRRHNNSQVKEICEKWWQIFITFSPRDQLSLFYLFWINNFIPSLVLPPELNTHNVSGIEFTNHPEPGFIKKIERKLRIWQNKIFLKFTYNERKQTFM